MSQTALVFFFLHGTHFLCDVEVDTLLGQGVVAHVISESIGQLTVTHIGIHRKLLCHGRHTEEHDQQQNEGFDFLHITIKF